jgi:hypothetical protein
VRQPAPRAYAHPLRALTLSRIQRYLALVEFELTSQQVFENAPFSRAFCRPNFGPKLRSWKRRRKSQRKIDGVAGPQTVCLVGSRTFLPGPVIAQPGRVTVPPISGHSGAPKSKRR